MAKQKTLADVISSLPNEDDQRRLVDVMQNEKEEVEIRGKKIDVGSLYNGTLEFITNIITKEKNELLVPVKCYAAIRLNGFFRLRLFYWFLWRWYAYIKEYKYDELIPVLEVSRKKVSGMWLNYVVATTSLTALKTTMMAMNRKEASAFQAEQLGAMRGIQALAQREGRQSHTSHNQDTSSSAQSRSDAGGTTGE